MAFHLGRLGILDVRSLLSSMQSARYTLPKAVCDRLEWVQVSHNMYACQLTSLRMLWPAHAAVALSNKGSG